MTIGKIALRKSAGVVTGVYEAKGTFTASADPQTDTTNWRHAGLVGQFGETGFWGNCETILNLTIRATFLVGIGTVLPFNSGFPHRWKGTVCRSGESLRVAKSDDDGSFEHAVTDDDWWEDYTGSVRADCDYAFSPSRYCVLEFQPGDLVSRMDTDLLTLDFYRCKVAVDHAGSADGTGDPATDTAHWEAYAGNRSLWLDFTAPVTAGHAAPFDDHMTPTTRYGRWKETTEVYLDSTLQGTRTREFTRDSISGDLTVISDDWAPSTNVAMPAPPAGEDTSGTFPPTDDPDTHRGERQYAPRHYHRPSILTTFELTGAVFPSSTVGFSYTRTNYSSKGDFLIKSADWGTEDWTTSTTAGSGSLSLTGLTIGATAIEFEFTGTDLPWYKEFDTNCSGYSATTLVATGSGDNTVYYWWCDALIGYTGGSSYTVGVNTLHTAALKVVQTIELLDEITQADHVDAAIALLPTFPSWGVSSDGAIARHGIPMTVTGPTSYSDPYSRNLYLNVANAGYDGGDTRLVENEACLTAFTVDMVTANHWTVEQTQGSAAVETAYTAAATHSFTPTDDTLKWAEVTTTEP
jgi:hypothetical protein